MAAKKSTSGKYAAKSAKAAYRSPGNSKKSGKKIFSSVLIALVIICFLAAGGLGVYLYFFSDVTPGLILNNVSVLGINIGGMTKNDALTTVQTSFEENYCANNMVVTMYDEQTEISADTAGLSLDAEGVVEAAYNLGRTGTQSDRKRDQLQALAGALKVDVAPYLSIDTDTLRQELDDLCRRFPSEAVDATWEITGERPDLTAEEMPESTQTLVVNMGALGYETDVDALLTQVQEAYLNAVFQVDYTCKTIEPLPVDLDAVYEEVCTAPVEAQMDQETFEVISHAYGYGFDLDMAKTLQQQRTHDQSFEVPFCAVAPVTTKANLEALLFRDVLGTYTAYSASDPANRDVNLKLSCKAINGIVLMPGEVFSYNPALGERTPEAGWKQADGYVGRETVKQYGGGICQASSCLYLSAMLADLEIVERVNHGFISSYMPYGMDATVSWGGPEFLFKNSTEYPLRIEAWSSGGAVTVRLVGTDTKDYYVKMTYEILSTDPFETVYEEMDADNEDGHKDGDVIISGYTGYRIRTYRCKYSKATDELISKEVEATSSYNRRDKVICKIKEEPTTEPSTEPSEEPTEESTEAPTAETTDPGISGPITEDN